MATLEQLGTVVETDVLVVGFGISGLAAAITTKEENASLKVLAVDKGCVGYAGKANKGGGHVAFIPEGADELYVEYHTRNCGDYLNDQDLIRKYAQSTVKTMDRWASWGVKFIGREHAGQAHAVIPWKVCIVDNDLMIPMAKTARKLGVEFMEKVTVTDLLKDGDKIVGAFGFSLLTGEPYIFKAKAVVLASGDQNFRIMRMWNSGRGDGIAAAYRAGAKLRNAEFGSFMNIMSAEHKLVAYGAEDALVNANGENCSERADLDPSLKSVVGGVDLGGSQSVLMYLDVREGKGPIYEDTRKNDFPNSFVGRNLCNLTGPPDPPFRRPCSEKFWARIMEKKHAGYRNDGPLKEVIPGVVAECSPLYVDHDYATSLTGLFASGDICGCGGGWAGAVPTPPGRNRGSGLMHAVMTAIFAGSSVAKYAAELPAAGNVDVEQVAKLKEETFAPLKRMQKGVTTHQVVREIGEIMQPVAYSGYKSEERLKEALDRVMVLKAKLPTLVAMDAHDLSSANECRSMVICAEAFYRASIERKESRGWHMREDFKARDDQKGARWIYEELGQDGEMKLSFVPLPMDQYKYKPE